MGVQHHATCPVVQLHVVDDDGRLAAVVDEPVVVDNLPYAASVEVHGDVELGLDRRISRVGARRVARRVNRDAGIGSDGALRPDIDPASTGEPDARAGTRAAVHLAGHGDRLAAIAVLIEPRDSVWCAAA